MWHEQRREERRIKGLMVDKQRRAERRRCHYEKFKTDPAQFLQVHGRGMKVHLDASIALAADAPTNMMPWNGDRSIMIDRFDGRGNLDYIPEYKPNKHDSYDKDDVEGRQLNYERYRILVQNDFLAIPEEKFLRMIDLEEKYGSTTYQNQKAVEEKKKSAKNKVSIGFVYDKPAGGDDEEELNAGGAHKSAQNKSDDESDSDSDSDMDFDLNVDMTSLGTEDQEQLNHTGLVYNLGRTDFIKMLATDIEEAEELRIQKEQIAQKASVTGKKSRRDRKIMKERLMEGRKIEEPCYRAKEEETEKKVVHQYHSESESEEEGREEKVEFITSFGGDSDGETKNGSHGVTFRKVLPATQSSKDHKSSSSNRKDTEKPKSTSKSSKRERSRSRSRGRDKPPRSRTRSPVSKERKISCESQPVAGDKIKTDERKFTPAPSNHHPSMLAYPPPPKPVFQAAAPTTPLVDNRRLDRPPPGFVPPLPSVPHPDTIKKTDDEENGDKKNKHKKEDTSDSSDDDKDKGNGGGGYRSKYRNKRASSDESDDNKSEDKKKNSIYKSSMSSFFSAVSGSGKGSTESPTLAPPPVKRYYGRRRENDSDSDIEIDSDPESKKKAPPSRALSGTKSLPSVKPATKESASSVLREKMRKKMQQQLKRSYKEDKKAAEERRAKKEEEEYYREEELREIKERMRAKERDREYFDDEDGASYSRSKSRSPQSSRRRHSPAGSREGGGRYRSRDSREDRDGRGHHHDGGGRDRGRDNGGGRRGDNNRDYHGRGGGRDRGRLVDY